MQNFPQLLLVEVIHDLPEPLDYLVVAIVGFLIFRILKPVVDIDEGHSVQDHFELIWLEYLQQSTIEHSIDSPYYLLERSLNMHFSMNINTTDKANKYQSEMYNYLFSLHTLISLCSSSSSISWRTPPLFLYVTKYVSKFCYSMSGVSRMYFQFLYSCVIWDWYLGVVAVDIL